MIETPRPSQQEEIKTFLAKLIRLINSDQRLSSLSPERQRLLISNLLKERFPVQPCGPDRRKETLINVMANLINFDPKLSMLLPTQKQMLLNFMMPYADEFMHFTIESDILIRKYPDLDINRAISRAREKSFTHRTYWNLELLTGEHGFLTKDELNRVKKMIGSKVKEILDQEELMLTRQQIGGSLTIRKPV